jgi:hypothetical protein
MKETWPREAEIHKLVVRSVRQPTTTAQMTTAENTKGKKKKGQKTYEMFAWSTTFTRKTD